MRLALAGLAFLLAFSGCLSDDDPAASNDDGMDSDTPAPAPPTPLHWESPVLAGADPFNVVPVVTPVGGGTPCSTAASTCFVYDFTLDASADLEATLAWGLPANDFDLYLYQDGTQLSSDGINQLGTAEVPPTTQVLRSSLGPGTYQFWVVAWNAVADAFTLDVAFP